MFEKTASLGSPRKLAFLGSALICAVALWFGFSAGPAKSQPEAKSSQALTQVSLATPNIASTAPVIKIGKLRGFFKKQGIDLKIVTNIPPQQIGAALLSNRINYGVFSWGALISLRANNIPIVGVANLAISPTNLKKDDSSILALSSSGIKTVKQLKGKKVGITALGGTSEGAIRTLEKKNKMPQDSIKFVPGLNFPDMAAALRAGRIDAGMFSEPYVTALKQQTKVNRIAAGNSSFIPGLPVSMISTTQANLTKNPKLVASFRKAMNQSVDYVKAHPNAVRKSLPGLLGVSPKVTKKMTLPTYSTNADKKKIQQNADALFGFGTIKKKVFVNDFVKTK